MDRETDLSICAEIEINLKVLHFKKCMLCLTCDDSYLWRLRLSVVESEHEWAELLELLLELPHALHVRDERGALEIIFMSSL